MYHILVVSEGRPGWPSIRSDTAIVPGSLFVRVFLQDEVVQFYDIGILIALSVYRMVLEILPLHVLTMSPNWFEVPSMQTTRFLPFTLWQHVCSAIKTQQYARGEGNRSCAGRLIIIGELIPHCQDQEPKKSQAAL